jgi:DNA (cytosine-5)-methyltransferase 1
VARYFAIVPAGGNWRQLPSGLQEEALGAAAFAAGGGKTGFFRRLSWDSPSPTITGRANRKASAVCHPEALRPLSVRESARLQGFPDNWAFVGSMSSQYMQVGNAVPVNLGIAVAKAVLRHEESRQADQVFENTDIERLLSLATNRLRSTARNKRGIDPRQLLLLHDENAETEEEVDVEVEVEG